MSKPALSTGLGASHNERESVRCDALAMPRAGARQAVTCDGCGQMKPAWGITWLKREKRYEAGCSPECVTAARLNRHSVCRMRWNAFVARTSSPL